MYICVYTKSLSLPPSLSLSLFFGQRGARGLFQLTEGISYASDNTVQDARAEDRQQIRQWAPRNVQFLTGPSHKLIYLFMAGLWRLTTGRRSTVQAAYRLSRALCQSMMSEKFNSIAFQSCLCWARLSHPLFSRWFSAKPSP